MDKRDIAQVAHEAIRSYRIAIGGGTMDYWQYIPKEAKDSYIARVEYIFNNPATTAMQSHDAWIKNKLDNGWLWGEVEDEKLRTHPMMVPFSKLTLEHQTEDALFIALVAALLPMRNYITAG